MIVSTQFDGVGLLDRQRSTSLLIGAVLDLMNLNHYYSGTDRPFCCLQIFLEVNEILKPFMARIHAVTMKCLAPSAWEARKDEILAERATY